MVGNASPIGLMQILTFMVRIRMIGGMPFHSIRPMIGGPHDFMACHNCPGACSTHTGKKINSFHLFPLLLCIELMVWHLSAMQALPQPDITSLTGICRANFPYLALQSRELFPFIGKNGLLFLQTYFHTLSNRVCEGTRRKEKNKSMSDVLLIKKDYAEKLH